MGCQNRRMLSNMTCTDINPNMLSICQKRIPMAKCILVDKEDTTLPCGSGKLKLLLCIEVIEVISSSWFIKESLRVLQDGGIIVGVFNNSLSLRGCFCHISSKIKEEFDYYKISYPKWRTIFCMNGFK